jgi:hypothetical protein
MVNTGMHVQQLILLTSSLQRNCMTNIVIPHGPLYHSVEGGFVRHDSLSQRRRFSNQLA